MTRNVLVGIKLSSIIFRRSDHEAMTNGTNTVNRGHKKSSLIFAAETSGCYEVRKWFGILFLAVFHLTDLFPRCQ